VRIATGLQGGDDEAAGVDGDKRAGDERRKRGGHDGRGEGGGGGHHDAERHVGPRDERHLRIPAPIGMNRAPPHLWHGARYVRLQLNGLVLEQRIGQDIEEFVHKGRLCELEEERAQISGYQVAGCATRTACHEDDAHGKGRRQSERHRHCKTEKRHDGVLAGEAKKHLLARYTRDAMKILIRDGG
jgi:hypothetical protein